MTTDPPRVAIVITIQANGYDEAGTPSLIVLKKSARVLGALPLTCDRSSNTSKGTPAATWAARDALAVDPNIPPHTHWFERSAGHEDQPQSKQHGQPKTIVENVLI